MGKLFFQTGLVALFFLPVLESINRTLGINLLLVSAILFSLPLFLLKKIVFDKINVVFSLLLLFFGLSTITSWSLLRSYISLNIYLAYFLIFIFVRNSNSKEYLRKYFTLMILTNALLLSLISIVYVILGRKFFLPVNSMSLYTQVSGHNRICDILVFAIPIALNQFLLEKKKAIKYFLGFLTLFFLAVFIFSFGRAAMLSLSFGYLLVILFFHNNFNIVGSRRTENLFAIILSVITMVILTSSFLYSNLIFPKDSQGAGFIYKPVMKERRLDYYLQAINGFRQSPFTGTGLDTFIYVSRQYQEKNNSHGFSSSAHNRYLQYFTETGIFGGIIFLILIFFFSKEICKNLLPFNLSFLVGLIASAIQATIDYNWDFLSIYLFFFIGVALILGEDKNKSLGNRLFLTNKFILLPIILIITLFLPFFIPFNSYKAQEKAAFLEKIGYKDKAEALLAASLSVDKKNTNLLTALAELNARLGSYDKAHKFYRQAILFNRINSDYLIKRDFIMRLKIRLSSEKPFINLPCNYNEIIQGFISLLFRQERCLER